MNILNVILLWNCFSLDQVSHCVCSTNCSNTLLETLAIHLEGGEKMEGPHCFKLHCLCQNITVLLSQTHSNICFKMSFFWHCFCRRKPLRCWGMGLANLNKFFCNSYWLQRYPKDTSCAEVLEFLTIKNTIALWGK